MFSFEGKTQRYVTLKGKAAQLLAEFIIYILLNYLLMVVISPYCRSDTARLLANVRVLLIRVMGHFRVRHRVTYAFLKGPPPSTRVTLRYIPTDSLGQQQAQESTVNVFFFY